MSKILAATCSPAGVVTVDGIPVAGTAVLNEGKQLSSGLLFLEGNLKKYLASNATDIKSVIEKLVDSLTDIATAFTSAATSITSLGGDGSSITAKVVEINLTITELNTLKGALK